jgi:UDP-N-acetylmuramyl pentapeptide phosphotransferase/UDP-N-acetylglucosamine-1-phosphate transferase
MTWCSMNGSNSRSFIVFCAAMVSAAGARHPLGLTYELGFALPMLVGWIGSALFVFVVVNAANFMDGSDGILAAVMIPAGIALCVAGLAAGVMTSVIARAALLAASLAGFVVLNWPPAKLFAGDVGALGAGALYAGGALALVNHGFSGTLWLAPLFVLVFLADVLLTLLRRARHGRFSLSAHREHAYQRLIDSGWSHQAIALVYGGLTALIGLTGLSAAQMMDGAVPMVFALGWWS